jgi:guanylate kinase
VNKASYELSFKNHFHKNILNDDLERACSETEQVIKEFLGW